MLSVNFDESSFYEPEEFKALGPDQFRHVLRCGEPLQNEYLVQVTAWAALA